MGILSSLRFLQITTKQFFIPQKVIGSLSSLRYLGFIECDKLEYLYAMQQLTNLRPLQLDSCASLKSLPFSAMHVRTLRFLRIENCENINLSVEEWSKSFPLRLELLALIKLPQLVHLPLWLQGSANTIRTIVIEGCPNLTVLPKWLPDLTSLQKLFIIMCPKLLFLPKGMLHLTSLEVLEIVGCSALYSRYNRETGADWSEIIHVPRVLIEETYDSCDRKSLFLRFQKKDYCYFHKTSNLFVNYLYSRTDACLGG
ncbi:Disease resistance protein [Quillaja saponaria]|uniref:Disease resistance protein n=1 Tax=Quillaja saponaria TaxID=32244 RepID=A0AAD7Q8G4_QUISA|nr:Disease resistance protein [Quillaja saponaria]